MDGRDLPDEVGVQDVVGVQHQIGVIVPPFPDAVQEELQGVALAHMAGILPGEDLRPVGAGDDGGGVGAVVRHHVGVQQLRGVVLSADAVQELADDGLLVPGGDEDRDPVPGGGGLGLFGLCEKADGEIHELIGIAKEEERHDDGIDRLHGTHRHSPDVGDSGEPPRPGLPGSG